MMFIGMARCHECGDLLELVRSAQHPKGTPITAAQWNKAAKREKKTGWPQVRVGDFIECPLCSGPVLFPVYKIHEA